MPNFEQVAEASQDEKSMLLITRTATNLNEPIIGVPVLTTGKIVCSQLPAIVLIKLEISTLSTWSIPAFYHARTLDRLRLQAPVEGTRKFRK